MITIFQKVKSSNPPITVQELSGLYGQLSQKNILAPVKNSALVFPSAVDGLSLLYTALSCYWHLYLVAGQSRP